MLFFNYLYYWCIRRTIILGEEQLKEVRAISDYQIALVDMAYATGTLMGYSKLSFQ
ncbi:hypothetical protein MCEMSEM29_00571 [Methylophilaceae bacterium]